VANATCAWISPNLEGRAKKAAVFKEKMHHHRANQDNSEKVWWASAVYQYYDLLDRSVYSMYN